MISRRSIANARFIGWATIAIFFLIFTPLPFS